MACFFVPVTEAVLVTAIEKAAEKKELKTTEAASVKEEDIKIPLSMKLKWLTHMLWGGSALLAFEHVWHGEVVPWFPFLTAMSSPEEAAEMAHEMATVGVSMAGLITLTWVGMCVVAKAIMKRSSKELSKTTK